MYTSLLSLYDINPILTYFYVYTYLYSTEQIIYIVFELYIRLLHIN
jgi:hypothetical protein